MCLGDLLGFGGCQLVVTGLSTGQTGLGLIEGVLQISRIFRGQHLAGLYKVTELHAAGFDVALVLEGQGDALVGDDVAGGADGLLNVAKGRLGSEVAAALLAGAQVAPGEEAGNQHHQHHYNQGDAASDQHGRKSSDE